MSRALLLAVVLYWSGVSAPAAETTGALQFQKDIKPVIEEFCYDCHADGMSKGGVALDELSPDPGHPQSRDVWWRAMKNLRASLMPPHKKAQPTPEQKERIYRWIKTAVFETNPADPDPGRVTVRRLNRVEYRNTVRDLIGVTYNTDVHFPPDDTGYGFDNIGDVLTLPPMLLEKYLIAATEIINDAVPTVDKMVPERTIPGRRFRSPGETEDYNGNRRNRRGGPLTLSFYEPALVTNVVNAEHAGRYELVVDVRVNDKYVDNVFDYNKCRLSFKVDGAEWLQRDFSWESGKSFRFDFDRDWQAGEHVIEFQLQPLTPDEAQTRSLSLQINALTVRGPMAREHWVRPRNYRRFFPRDVPQEADARRAYARELLDDFADRAFRRPAPDKTVDGLVALAESIYSQQGKTFEQGVAQGMVAVLASPRFLFREEDMEKAGDGISHPYVDDFALASRLSYFLWSSMPDEELFRLAREKKLRQDLSGQVARMLKDERSEALVENFTGQWLHARDIESVTIDARSVLAREERFDAEFERQTKRFRELNDKADDSLTTEERDELAELRSIRRRKFRGPLRAELTGDLRRAMRQETEKVFDYVLRNDRNLIELIDSDYTFLNERLARHYGIPNVSGDEVRLVKLPADSPRGGILTHGTVLAVTSNPTRTSPVKRGVFILDNILGTPSPPPPPDIPPLEDAIKTSDRAPSLRESLAVHREKALCSSCHNRMDPLGLAFENFNAMGQWRDSEFGEAVDATGAMITGENFTNAVDLKEILADKYAVDFYRTMTEKLLTYALGRGLEHYDVETVDRIVARVIGADGRPSALVAGIVESAPFQKTRRKQLASSD